MTYKLKPNTMYMMPTHFGPMCGPRQGPGGEVSAFSADERKTRKVSVSFLTNQEQLQDLLPEGFELFGDPVVTVDASYMTEIAWLAGRGYNVLGVTIGACYEGKRDSAVGPFLLVLWENLTDPILTGREQLGFSKIYCDLPEPLMYQDSIHCAASWQGFRFLDITVDDLSEEQADPATPVATSSTNGVLKGQLHYKYIPKTGVWGEPDVAYAVLSPAHEPLNEPTSIWSGAGTVKFRKACWEDLPTQYMIVNALSDLEIKDYCGASVQYSVGARDLGDQRILE